MKRNSKYALYISFVLATALFAMYEWKVLIFEPAKKKEAIVYSQCDKVFVRKTPFACNPGDLIYIDADVADKYCTDKIFSRTETSVYCIYNGKRDRERTGQLFRKEFSLKRDN